MKKLLVALAFVPALASAQQFSREGGREHVLFSAAFGLGCTSIFQDSTAKAFGCAMVPGLVKEVADSRSAGNHFSASDLKYDALGALIGVAVGNVLIRRQNGTTTVSFVKEF